MDLFAHPPSSPVGWAAALHLSARILAPWGPWIGNHRLTYLATPQYAPIWWLAAPAMLLVGAAAISRSAQDRLAGRLTALVAAAAVMTVVAEARIVGLPYAYLSAWSRSVACLALLCPAVALCRKLSVPTRLGEHGPQIALGAVVAGTLLVGLVVPLPQSASSNASYARLLRPAASAVPRGAVVRVVSDGLGFAHPETSMVVELRRAGRVGLVTSDVAGNWRVVGPNRILPTLAIGHGPSIDALLGRTGAEIVSSAGSSAVVVLLPPTTW